MPTKEVTIGDGPFDVIIHPTHAGRPARVDGPVQVTISDPTLATATVGPDGLTVTIQEQSKEGTCDVTFAATVHAHDGTRVEKDAVLTLAIVPAEADQLDLEVRDQQSPPPPQPPPPPVPPPQPAP